MLKHLSIRDVLLIESVDLDFADGLNVLTGETGAGKSILLDSLGFVLGWRGRAELVRAGAETGEVTAVFEIAANHPAVLVLENAGITFEGDIILRRINYRDGRKRAFVNDRICSAEVLRTLSDCLVEIHGQNDDKGLLDPRGHLALLDSFARVEKDLGRVKSAWAAQRAAGKALDVARADLAKLAEDGEFLQHTVDELLQMEAQPGEDAELDEERRRMQAADRIRADIQKAADFLGGSGAEGAMDDALRWLGDSAELADGALEGPIDALGRAMGELSDAQAGVQMFLNALDVNPFELEQIEERLFAIRAMARKHNVLPDALQGLLAECQLKLTQIDLGATHMVELEASVVQTRGVFQDLATKLSTKRQLAGGRLDKAMMAELAPLKMERAVFTTEFNKIDGGARGIDQIMFTVSTNPGAPVGAINKIASGGELSRFLLALKVCLTTRASGLTLIFDEIDRGIGGATADAVGRRLKAVSEDTQVLVVTHSPQVAAMGEAHFLVSKAVSGGQTRTDVVALTGDTRRDEVARMLAGEVITDAARGAADALMG